MRAENTHKVRKNDDFRKSADQHKNQINTCALFKNRRFPVLLRCSPRACKRSASSEYFERLNNEDSETEKNDVQGPEMRNFGWHAAAPRATRARLDASTNIFTHTCAHTDTQLQKKGGGGGDLDG